MSDTPLRRQILPFRKSVKIMLINFWHLRSFLLLIFVVLLASSSIFYAAEYSHFSVFLLKCAKLKELAFITVNDVLPVNISSYMPSSFLGKCMSCVNALCGFVLLGFFIWVIQASLQGQDIKKSKWVFFSTNDNV